jgi:malate/lactate dehydrogenase
MEGKTFTVCVTGAAGQIAYAFLPQLCKGLVFPGVGIHLRMLDITSAVKAMQGVAFELLDCSFSALKSVNRV